MALTVVGVGLDWSCAQARAQTFDDPDAALCYNEPTTSGAGPLTDLAGCTLTGEDASGTFLGSETLGATDPAGGGQVCTTPRTVVPGLEGSVIFAATCSDFLANASGRSNTITRTFPGIPPDPPTLLP